MKRITILVALLLPFIMKAQNHHDTTRTNVAQVSLIYPIGSAGTNSLMFANHVSLNLTYGLNGGVRGVEFGGVGNFNSGSVEGVQVGGAININTKSSKGVFLSGAVNMNSESVRGIQTAGVFNLSVDESVGLMTAGVFNSSDGIEGVQVAGVANISTDDAVGLQLAGVYNSAKNVDGLQVSGLINIAQTVKGMQFAPLINIADTSDYAIGLINLVKSGEKSLSMTMDETGSMLASFRSGGRVLYSILGLGYNFRSDKISYASEGGFGAHLLKGHTPAGDARMVRLRVEAVVLNLSDLEDDLYFRASMRMLPGIRKGNFELFAGPTFNYVYTDHDQSRNLVDNYLWENTDGGHLDGLYIGFTGGLNYIF